MAEKSSSKPQGVPSFEYTPQYNFQPLLPLETPLDDLVVDLLGQYSGRTLEVETIYQAHNGGTNYIRANYKEALVKMESENLVQVYPTLGNRRRRNGIPTMGDKVQITFG